MSVSPRRLLRTLLLLVIIGVLAGLLLPRSSYLLRLWYPLPYSQEVVDAAEEEGLPASLVAAIIYEESRFDPEARSDKGAQGLMQVMPSTAEWVYGKFKIPNGELADPEHNIAVGTRYLSYLLSRYGDYRLALAAYNAGETTLDGWLREKGLTPQEAAKEAPIDDDDDEQEGDFFDTIPFVETREYVRRVAESRIVYQRVYGLD